MRTSLVPRKFPIISPVSLSGDRPLWSVMIPTYQCAEYLKEALASVLAQDPGPAVMQIEVVDDCSSDDPESVVRALGNGRVGFFRQQKNLGLVGNFNSCIQRSRGHWLHLLHGDDLVLPGFYRSLERPCGEQSEIMMAFCRHHFVDAKSRPIELSKREQPNAGVLANFGRTLGREQCIQCPSVVVRRAAYETIGGFSPELRFTADWDMWKRVTCLGKVWYEPEAYAAYRRHHASDSSTLYRNGENVRQIYRSIRFSQLEHPEVFDRPLSFAAFRITAIQALYQTKTYARSGDFEAAWRQYRLAWNRAAIPLFPRLIAVGVDLFWLKWQSLWRQSSVNIRSRRRRGGAVNFDESQ